MITDKEKELVDIMQSLLDNSSARELLNALNALCATNQSLDDEWVVDACEYCTTNFTPAELFR